MISKQVTVKACVNKEPGLLCKIAERYASQIYIEKGNRRVNAKTVIGVFSLKLECGDKVTLIVSGKDEKLAQSGIVDYLENGLENA